MFQPPSGLQHAFFLSLDLCWSFLFKEQRSNTTAQRRELAHREAGALCSALTDGI